MPAFDWTPYAVGGATRPDSFIGLDPEFLRALETMFAQAPDPIRQNLRVGSGYRSIQRQQELWDASDKTGKMVARPGKSHHNHGTAADLKYLNDDAKKWVHANAAQYGLHFPMSWEDWHIEPVGSRGGAPVQVASGAPAPAITVSRDVADVPIAAFQPANSPSTAPAQAPESALGGILAALAPAMSVAAPIPPAPAVRLPATTTETPLAPTIEQSAARAKGLKQALMPDISALTALGGRKTA